MENKDTELILDIPFSGYDKAKGDYKHFRTSFLQEMESIRNGDYQKDVEGARAAREIAGDEEYKEYKAKNVWCFTPGVNSKKNSRARPTPDELTGLFVLDIDDPHQDQIINKKKLKTYPWIIAVGHSIGGVGLFAIAKGEPGRFKESHASARRILTNDGIKSADGQQDENRLRFTSWDPDLYFVTDPAAAPTVPIQIKESNPVKSVTDNNREEIFLTILKIKSKGKSFFDVGGRHAFLISVAGWCNRIGMSKDFCVEMAEKHCYPMIADADNYNIAKQIDGEYRSYRHQFNTWAWDEKNPPAEQPLTSTEFIPNWTNKPPYVPPVLKLAGTNILTYQNISTITAAPGSGKTSCVEAITASFLNPQADCLGFEVDSACKGVLVIDTERTKTDVWNSFYRMARRANIQEGSEIDNVKIIGMRGVSDPEERKKIIIKYVQDNLFSLLLIDGVADLVSDTNNIEQVKNAQDWLKALTVNYDLSIVGTIHPNPGTTKARGHTGAEMLRDSETVLIIKDFEGAKVLTSDFEHGKNRNTAKITAGFKWSDEKMMFISVDHESLATNKKALIGAARKNEAEKLARKLLQPPCAMRPEELKSAIMTEIGVARRTAHEQIKDWSAHGFINKLDDYYRLAI